MSSNTDGGTHSVIHVVASWRQHLLLLLHGLSKLVDKPVLFGVLDLHTTLRHECRKHLRHDSSPRTVICHFKNQTAVDNYMPYHVTYHAVKAQNSNNCDCLDGC